MKKYLSLILMFAVVYSYTMEMGNGTGFKRPRSADLDEATLIYQSAPKDACIDAGLGTLWNVLQNHPNVLEVKELLIAAQGIKVYSQLVTFDKDETREQQRTIRRLSKNTMIKAWNEFNEAAQVYTNNNTLENYKAELQRFTNIYNQFGMRIFGTLIPQWELIMALKKELSQINFPCPLVQKLKEPGLII